MSDDDRVTIVSALPAIAEDAEGATSTSNPLTTDANGYASCFITGGKYDVKISGGGQATRLVQDVAAVGGETNRSTVYMSGSAVAWIWDTLRTAAVGDTLAVLRNAGNDRFKVQGDGEIVSGSAGATHSLTGSLAVSNGAAVTGAVSSTTTVTAGTGVTSTTGNIQATAGDLLGRRLLMSQGTPLVTGDFALNANWGNTATISLIGATAYDTHGRFAVTCNGAGIGADPTVQLTFKDGVFSVAPHSVICHLGTPPAPTTAFWTYGSSTTALIIWRFIGLPVAGSSYQASYIVVS